MTPVIYGDRALLMRPGGLVVVERERELADYTRDDVPAPPRRFEPALPDDTPHRDAVLAGRTWGRHYGHDPAHALECEGVRVTYVTRPRLAYERGRQDAPGTVTLAWLQDGAGWPERPRLLVLAELSPADKRRVLAHELFHVKKPADGDENAAEAFAAAFLAVGEER